MLAVEDLHETSIRAPRFFIEINLQGISSYEPHRGEEVMPTPI